MNELYRSRPAAWGKLVPCSHQTLTAPAGAAAEFLLVYRTQFEEEKKKKEGISRLLS